jgi:phospholipid transport system substrate-binding protein
MGGPILAGILRGKAGLAVMLLLALAPAPVFAASGSDTVQSFYNSLLTTMKSGRTLGESGRFVQLQPVVRTTFDVASMARLSVGSPWATISEHQRQQVTEGFLRYISAIYADRFDSYSGQKLQVIDEQEQPAGGGVIVHSQIVKANGDPVKVDYLLHRIGDLWLIADIYLDGTISEVATRRSEFGAIVKNDGIDGLIATLNRKADMLTGTTAKSF